MIEFLKMEIHKSEKYFSILLHDKKENIKFWVDCSLIDGYGYNTEEGEFIDWNFNQYIFWIEDENDQKAQAYQQKGENIDRITDFIDENTSELIKQYKKEN